MQRKPRNVEAEKASSKKSSKKPQKVEVVASRFLEELQALNSKDKDAFGFFGRDGLDTPINEFVSTGNLAIDKLIGGRQGGWPIGRLSECASWEAVGKSTLVDQSLAQVQRMGGIAAVIDTEHARDVRYTKCLGVDTDKLITKSANTVEEVFKAIDAILTVQEKIAAENKRRNQPPPPLLLVWDSLGATPTNAEVEGEADDRHVADAARVIKLNLRRICARIAGLRIAFVVVNHFYADIGPFGTIKTSGGSGIRYFTSLRLWMTAKNKIKIGDKIFGHEVEVKTKKTRIISPRPPVTTGLIYGGGFDNAYTLFNWGRLSGLSPEHRWIQERGQWQYLILPDGTDLAFNQKFVGLGRILADRPDVYQMLATHFMNEGEGVVSPNISTATEADEEEEDGETEEG